MEEVSSEICYDVFKYMILSLCETKFGMPELPTTITLKTDFNS